MNTSRLENKSWFLGLLLSGIFGFGFLAVIAYLVVGPEGTGTAALRRTAAPVAAGAA